MGSRFKAEPCLHGGLEVAAQPRMKGTTGRGFTESVQ